MCLSEGRLYSQLGAFGKHTAQLLREESCFTCCRLNEQLWEETGEACWPVTQQPDQACVGNETVMDKLLSKKIIIAEALLAAGGRSVKDQVTEGVDG